VDPRVRKALARFGAPAAFLAAATVAVLLIKAGLSGGDSSSVTTSTAGTVSTRVTPATTSTTARITVTTPTSTASADAAYYTIQSGDTLGSVAARYDTTVDELLSLNPGVDPEGLRVGQRIRVS
jgi:LysM repeat protein